MRKIIYGTLILLIILLFIGCVNFFKLSDLRTSGYQFPNNTAKAKQLLEEMAVAHNINMWDSIETYNVTYEDEFYGFLGKQGNPFSEQAMKFSLSYIPKTFNGQLEILNGKEKGQVWGMQDWQTYRKNEDGTITPKKDKDMKFWIPTYQYFVELPSRIQEASAIDYLGESEVEGVKVEGVLASWNTVEPQKDIDQYILWIDSKSKRIVKVEYTVRDAYRFIAGAAVYQKYIDYDGFILPSEMPVESNLLKEGYLHKMSIRSFTPNPIEKEMLMPLK